jgi:hypothetical protein
MEKETNAYTVLDYLANKVNFEVYRETVIGILSDRGVDPSDMYVDSDKDTMRLAYADLLKWFLLGPSKVNNTSDSDNGWTHSGGGYDMSDDDRAEMKAEANAIYKELEPGSMLKKKSSFRIISHGVKRASYSPWGGPLPHLIK